MPAANDPPLSCKVASGFSVPAAHANPVIVPRTSSRVASFLTLVIVVSRSICFRNNKVSVRRLPLDESPLCRSTELFYIYGQRPTDGKQRFMKSQNRKILHMGIAIAGVTLLSAGSSAFLAQQSDVMDAVQRMRAKAQGTGNLKTSAQQKVETQTVAGGKQVIVVEPANPDVVYVPSYDPQVVYGPPAPEYPYYPYTYPGYVPGTALAWGAGVALGAAAWGAWGGHWGDCDWNGGNVKINNNYNYNRNNNFNRNVSRQGQGNWQHNPQHRGTAPYGNRQTANKYGGTARGQGGRGAGAGAGTRPGAGGAGTRPGGAGAGTRPGSAGAGTRSGGGGAGNRPGGGGAGARRGGGGAGARPGGGGAAARRSGGSA